MRASMPPRSRAASSLLWCSFALAMASGASNDTSTLAMVPWIVVAPGEPYRPAPLIVFWVPRSADDFRRSELLGFRPLIDFAGPCVSFQVIRNDDRERIEKLGVAGKLPAVLLAAPDGRVVVRVAQEKGEVTGAAVEKALTEELRMRQESAGLDLDDAPRKLAIGDREGAIALYRRVCEQRCLLPRHAREAERALRKLGVPMVASSQ